MKYLIVNILYYGIEVPTQEVGTSDSMLITYILISSMPGDPHFSFDRSAPSPIFYLTKSLSTTAPLKTSTIVVIQSSQKRGVLDNF